ncbi:hypothetical protein ACFL4W_00690 [Planctomycetota bacterium]
MKQYMFTAILLTVLAVTGAWGSSFFEIELSTNAAQGTDFKDVVGSIDTGTVELGGGSSLGFYIGSEMALDFNLKLNFELGFHYGTYGIDAYSTNIGGVQDTTGAMSYNHYMVLMGIRLKYDVAITHNCSLEPYIMAGITPVYMYSPSARFETQLQTDIDIAGSFTFDQSDIWALSYVGLGFDIDLTRSEVEHSGSSKYLFGISFRSFERAVTFGGTVSSTKYDLLCLTGTVMF